MGEAGCPQDAEAAAACWAESGFIPFPAVRTRRPRLGQAPLASEAKGLAGIFEPPDPHTGRSAMA